MGGISSFGKIVIRPLRFSAGRILDLVDNILGLVELHKIKNKWRHPLEKPPLFIVGPPRSGTTLLYQLLIARFKLGYISNIAAFSPKAPLIGSKIANMIVTNKINNFSSKYGRTKGLNQPHEFGAFWRRWFPAGENEIPPYAYVPWESKIDLRELRSEIVALTEFFNAPMVFKIVENSFRLAPLSQIFPEALFLICKRNPLDIAQSILKMRVNRLGTKDKWIAVKPKEYERIKDYPYYLQISYQIYYTYKQIYEDADKIGVHRFLEVHYEDVCKDVHSELERIKRFVWDYGCQLVIKSEVPKKMELVTGRRVSEDDYIKLKKAVQSIWK